MRTGFPFNYPINNSFLRSQASIMAGLPPPWTQQQTNFNSFGTFSFGPQLAAHPYYIIHYSGVSQDSCCIVSLLAHTALPIPPPSSSLRNVLSYRHFAVVLAFSRFVAIALFLVYSHVSCILFVLRTLLSFLAILSPLLSQLQVIQLCSQ